MVVLQKSKIFQCTFFLTISVLKTTEAYQRIHVFKRQLCNGECCEDSIKFQGYCIECPPGKFGIRCAENCQNNLYGRLCQKKCDCSDGFFCSPIYGCIPSPVEGCPEGKHGLQCQDNCEPRRYGVNCSSTCNCNEEQYCNSEKGCRDIPETRCPTGQYGPKCSLPCPQDRYGVNCSSTCMCEANQLCHEQHGCQNITATPAKTIPGRILQWVKKNIIPIASGLSGLAIGAVIVSVILYAKRRCVCTKALNSDRERQTVPSTFMLQDVNAVSSAEGQLEPVPVFETLNETDPKGETPFNRHLPHREERMYGRYPRTSDDELHDFNLDDEFIGQYSVERRYDEPMQENPESHRYAPLDEPDYSNEMISEFMVASSYSNERWMSHTGNVDDFDENYYEDMYGTPK